MADEERITVEVAQPQAKSLRGLLLGALALLGLNLAALVVVIVRMPQPTPPPATNQTGQPVWEYRTDYYPETTVDTGMTQAGADGWEAYATRRAQSNGGWGAEVSYRRMKRR